MYLRFEKPKRKSCVRELPQQFSRWDECYVCSKISVDSIALTTCWIDDDGCGLQSVDGIVFRLRDWCSHINGLNFVTLCWNFAFILLLGFCYCRTITNSIPSICDYMSMWMWAIISLSILNDVVFHADSFIQRNITDGHPMDLNGAGGIVDVHS